MMTTATSAAAHHFHGNVDRRMFVRLVPAGMAGGLLGAYVLTSVSGDTIRPFIIAYLALMGVFILLRSFARARKRHVPGRLMIPLGLAGGFCDATGGGGWGPVVTPSLIGAGGNPRFVIGTVNASEFFVSLAVSPAFLTAVLTGHWGDMGELTSNASAVAGLVTGGVAAAPLAGYLTKLIRPAYLMRMVGLLVSGLAIWQFHQLLG